MFGRFTLCGSGCDLVVEHADGSQTVTPVPAPPLGVEAAARKALGMLCNLRPGSAAGQGRLSFGHPATLRSGARLGRFAGALRLNESMLVMGRVRARAPSTRSGSFAAGIIRPGAGARYWGRTITSDSALKAGMPGIRVAPAFLSFWVVRSGFSGLGGRSDPGFIRRRPLGAF
jgi:hypothetical protein